jgi:ATP adenylyltransferase
MPRIKAPSNLPELVKSTFTKARSEGDLHYFPTQVTILNVDSIPVSDSLIFTITYNEKT